MEGALSRSDDNTNCLKGEWHCHLDPPVLCQTDRSLSHSGGLQGGHLESNQTSRQPAQASIAKDTLELILICLLLLCLPFPAATAHNPHLPVNTTWLLINNGTGKLANSTSSSNYPKDTWYPDLYVDLCDLVGSDWDPSDHEPFPGYGCNSPGFRASTRSLEFYVCPGHDRSKTQQAKCGGPREGYCASWGCESTGWINWHPPITGDLITVQRAGDLKTVGTGICTHDNQRVDCGPCYDKEQFPYHLWATAGGRCNMLVISFTEAGRKADWTTGKTWGLRLYRTGYDPVLLFTLHRTSSPIPTTIGPNKVLDPIAPPPQRPTQPLLTTTGSQERSFP
ncbi:envelope glycoprotein [Cricetulus griseus]|nr:envelope glycoprotein [Cricetulus griseus]